MGGCGPPTTGAPLAARRRARPLVAGKAWGSAGMSLRTFRGERRGRAWLQPRLEGRAGSWCALSGLSYN